MRAADTEGAFEGAREDAVPQASCGRDGEPRMPQPAWLSRPRRGRWRGCAWDGCCGRSAQGPDGSSAGVKRVSCGAKTELIGAVFADRRARLDALRVRCRKRASSAAKPRPHCNSSRRWSATAAVPGARRSRRRAPCLAPPPAFRCAAPRREAKGEEERPRRTERPLRVAAGRWRKGRPSADVGLAGAPSFPKGEGGALCRLSLVRGKRRFLATKPRSGTLRRSFGVLWPAPILPTWAFAVREHSFPLRWGGFRARTRFGGQKSRAREHERASRCVRGGVGRVGRFSRLWAMRSARLPMRNGRGESAKQQGGTDAKQTSDKRRERGTGLTRGNGRKGPIGCPCADAQTEPLGGRVVNRKEASSPDPLAERLRGQAPLRREGAGPRAAGASAARKPRPAPHLPGLW